MFWIHLAILMALMAAGMRPAPRHADPVPTATTADEIIIEMPDP